MNVQLAAGLTSTFFMLILAVPAARKQNTRGVILRIVYVSGVAAVTAVYGPLVAAKYVRGTTAAAYLQSMQLGPSIQQAAIAFAKGLAITVLPYLAPLIYNGASLPGSKLLQFRNVVVGPVTEEIVYRSFIISLYKHAGYSNSTIMWQSPLFFGVAHLNNGLFAVWDGRSTKSQAFFESLAQLTMTTLFGIYASKLFFSFGSVWAPIAAHMFCNSMGVPEASKSKFSKVLLVAGFAVWWQMLRVI